MEEFVTREFRVEREIAEAVRAEISSRVRLKFCERRHWLTSNSRFTVTGPAKALDEVEAFITARAYDAWLDRQ